MSKTTIHKHLLFIYISSIYSFIEQIIFEGLSCTQHRNSSWGLHFSGRKTDSKLINKTIYSFSNADMSHCRGKTPQKTKEDIISVLHINSWKCFRKIPNPNRKEVNHSYKRSTKTSMVLEFPQSHGLLV